MGRSEKSNILQNTLYIFVFANVIHSTLLVELCMAIFVLGGCTSKHRDGFRALCVCVFFCERVQVCVF